MQINIKIATMCLSVFLPFCELAEVHGVARSTSSYPSRLPALGHKWWLKIFYQYKVYPLNLESLNQTKTIPVVLPSSQIEIWGKTVKRLELWSDLDKLNKDKNIQFLFYRYSMIRKKHQNKNFNKVTRGTLHSRCWFLDELFLSPCTIA